MRSNGMDCALVNSLDFANTDSCLHSFHPGNVAIAQFLDYLEDMVTVVACRKATVCSLSIQAVLDTAKTPVLIQTMNPIPMLPGN